MAKTFITTDYYDLSWYIGEPLEIIKGASVLCKYRLPESINIIADYGITVLVEMTYIKSEYGRLGIQGERKIKVLISKAAMAVGDIVLQVKSTGEFLTGESIARYTMNAKIERVKELIWE